MNGNVIPLTPRPQPNRPGPAATPDRTAYPTPAARQNTSAETAVYTVAEVADLLSLALGTTYALIRTGQIPASKLGGRWIVPRHRFHTWLNELPDATPDDIDRELRRLDTSGEPGEPNDEVRP